MDFSLSQEQQDLIDLAKKLIIADKPSDVLWEQLSDLGFMSINFNKRFGGLDLTFLEVCLVLEVMGSKALTLPYINTMIAGNAIEEYGSTALKDLILPNITKGKLILSLALLEPGSISLEEPKIILSTKNKGYELNGKKICVAYAKESSYILVSCLLEKEVKLILINSEDPSINFTKLDSTSGEPQYLVEFKNTQIGNNFTLSSDVISNKDILKWIINRNTIGLCSFALGVNEESLKLTTSYTSQRIAFGVPVASFQAVSHKAADCYIGIACFRAVTEQAISKIVENKCSDKAISIAKVWCGDVCHKVSYASQHMHGGIGVDKQYSLYKYNLWAKQLELSFGSSQYHLNKLSDFLLENT